MFLWQMYHPLGHSAIDTFVCLHVDLKTLQFIRDFHGKSNSPEESDIVSFSVSDDL